MRSLHRTVGPSVGFLLIAFLVACASQPGLREGLSPQESDRVALDLLRAGQPAAAAREFLNLAELAPPPERYAHALHAAEAYIEAREPAAAEGVLGGLQIPESESFLSAWHGVLRARLHLEGDPKALLARLERLDSNIVPPGFRLRYHEYRAAVYLRLGEYLKAAREHVALDPLFVDDARRAANARATWEALSRLDVPYLSQHLPADARVLRGWMELAIIARAPMYTGAPFEARVRDWTLRYPGHPATREILPTLAEQRTALEFEPQHIALLLPLTGDYAAPSAAIRDGFLAAWYHDPGHYRRRVLTIYDANAANSIAVYRRALEEGADFVVGPLDKPAIRALVKGNAVTVPTLALNELGNPTSRASAAPATEMLFQFGLSPEDEARQVAERAWLDGRVRARVIAPESSWGGRVVRAFEGHWQELGGEVVVRISYRPNTRDLKGAIERLLAGVEHRHAPLATADAFAVPQDTPASAAEFIFMAANPRDARLIQPLIAYHGASQEPIYSTSHAYSGTVSRESDRDLDGLVFPDMPWVLDAERDPVRYEVERHWSRALGAYVRFYAFGADACALITHLARLSRDPLARLEGATGLLRLDPDGAVRRQLTWARFSGGVPVPVDH